jgi:hypothetical protein
MNIGFGDHIRCSSSRESQYATPRLIPTQSAGGQTRRHHCTPKPLALAFYFGLSEQFQLSVAWVSSCSVPGDVLVLPGCLLDLGNTMPHRESRQHVEAQPDELPGSNDAFKDHFDRTKSRRGRSETLSRIAASPHWTGCCFIPRFLTDRRAFEKASGAPTATEWSMNLRGRTRSIVKPASRSGDKINSMEATPAFVITLDF